MFYNTKKIKVLLELFTERFYGKPKMVLPWHLCENRLVEDYNRWAYYRLYVHIHFMPLTVCHQDNLCVSIFLEETSKMSFIMFINYESTISQQ